MSKSQFPIVDVESDATVDEVAEREGVSIGKGCAFYLLGSKQENVSAGKRLVCVHKKTGEVYADADARDKLQFDGAGKVKASQWPAYDVFIQTTSTNRKLKAPTKICYDAGSGAGAATKSKPKTTKPEIKAKAKAKAGAKRKRDADDDDDDDGDADADDGGDDDGDDDGDAPAKGKGKGKGKAAAKKPAAKAKAKGKGKGKAKKGSDDDDDDDDGDALAGSADDDDGDDQPKAKKAKTAAKPAAKPAAKAAAASGAASGAGAASSESVNPLRFPVVSVADDATVDEVASTHGLSIGRGDGFYLLGNKKESINMAKRIVIRHKSNGEVYCDESARQRIGLTATRDAKACDFADWNVFVQSTSANRKLKAPTKLCYENHSQPMTLTLSHSPTAPAAAAAAAADDDVTGVTGVTDGADAKESARATKSTAARTPAPAAAAAAAAAAGVTTADEAAVKATYTKWFYTLPAEQKGADYFERMRAAGIPASQYVPVLKQCLDTVINEQNGSMAALAINALCDDLPEYSNALETAMEAKGERYFPGAELDAKLPLGASKTGGLPHWPPGNTVEWPHYRDFQGTAHDDAADADADAGADADGAADDAKGKKQYATFVAQLNCRDIAPYDLRGLLPATGMLYVFTYGDPIKAPGVVWWDGPIASLVRDARAPDDTASARRYRRIGCVPLRKFELSTSGSIAILSEQAFDDGEIEYFDPSERAAGQDGDGSLRVPDPKWIRVFGAGGDEMAMGCWMVETWMRWGDVKAKRWNEAIHRHDED